MHKSYRLFSAILILLLISTYGFTQEKKTKPEQAKNEVQAQKDRIAQHQTRVEKRKEEKPPEPFSTATFNGLKLRLIGPAQISGRIVSIAVNPQNHSEFYVGVASGGVWKTVNGGTTFTPVFDGEGSYSIGYITLDPKDPQRRLGGHRREQLASARWPMVTAFTNPKTAASRGRTSD